MPVKEKFTMPEGMVQDEQTATSQYGKFVIEPLEKGFGHTLGNALRRALLSSMEGVAVTAVRIDGVLHEFATLSGVVEDVTEIILNMKRVHFLCDGDLPRTLELRATKAGPVTAAAIVEDGVTTVINKDQLICTLDREIPFRMEIEIDRGCGYRPSEDNKKSDHPAGTITVDSLFSPVERVRYIVSDCRVGQRTDYDSLELEVWTDARIVPQEAVQKSAQLLREYLGIFVGETAEEKIVVGKGGKKVQISAEEQEQLDRLLTPVGEIEFSVRAKNCLNNADIVVLGQLIEKTESEMLKYRNFGKKSLQEIKSKLQELGLSLGMAIKEEVRVAFHQKLESLLRKD